LQYKCDTFIGGKYKCFFIMYQQIELCSFEKVKNDPELQEVILRFLMLCDLNLYHSGAQHWSKFVDTEGSTTVSTELCLDCKWVPFHSRDWLERQLSGPIPQLFLLSWEKPKIGVHGDDQVLVGLAIFCSTHTNHFDAFQGTIRERCFAVRILAVSPGFLGRGVGFNLMNKIKFHADHKLIYVAKFAFDAKLDAFYKRQGFNKIGDDSAKRSESQRSCKDYLDFMTYQLK
jgi:GNAT superfamily N-acetyltransferase